jgi:hypothetical protein
MCSTHGIQLSGPAVDGDLPGPLSVSCFPVKNEESPTPEQVAANIKAADRMISGSTSRSAKTYLRGRFLLRVACLLPRAAPVRISSALRCCRDGG